MPSTTKLQCLLVAALPLAENIQIKHIRGRMQNAILERTEKR